MCGFQSNIVWKQGTPSVDAGDGGGDDGGEKTNCITCINMGKSVGKQHHGQHDKSILNWLNNERTNLFINASKCDTCFYIT